MHEPTASGLAQKRVLAKEFYLADEEKAEKPFQLKVFMVARRIHARREDVKKALKQRFVASSGVRFYYLESANRKNSARIITSGIKGAVDRNRIKRLFREALWYVIKNDATNTLKGISVVMVNSELKMATLKQIKVILEGLVKRIYSK